MRAALPLAAATLCWGAHAASREWLTPKCPVITPQSWVNTSCWSPPGPPPSAANDTVTFATRGVATTVNTTSGNLTVDVITIPNMVISAGARVELLQGSLNLVGTATVSGELVLRGAPDWDLARDTSNKDALKVDPHARALGLRDCAYTPVGFTPRLCGAGKFVIASGGVMDLQGMYASSFADILVKQGGIYGLGRGAHHWGLIENYGAVNAFGLIYWHGMIDNYGSFKQQVQDTLWFDEYTYYDGVHEPTPEKFARTAFVNYGSMDLPGYVLRTDFLYTWQQGKTQKVVSGKYTASFANKANGTMSTSGIMVGDPHGAPVANEGSWTNTGRLTASFDNSGTFLNTGTVNGQSFSNTGTVHQPGYMTLAKAVTNSGTWQQPGGVLDSGSFTNNGVVTAASSVLKGTNFTNHKSLEAANATLGFSILHNLGTAALSPSSTNIENNGSLVLVAGQGLGFQSRITNSPGARVLFPKGAGTQVDRIDNMGEIVLDGRQLWVTTATCISCRYYLSEGATLHFQSVGQRRTPQSLIADLPRGRGTPALCTEAGCVPDPCPYAVSPFSGDANVTGPCQAGDKGELPGVIAYGTCYACTSGHHLGLLADKAALERLISVGRGAGGGGDGPAPGADQLARRLYHFEGGVVDGDGTGSLVLTAGVHLHGGSALRVHRTRMHTVLESGLPALVGGGRLTLRQGSSLRLGVLAVLEDGGSIVAEPGTAVIVDSHAWINARNHSLHISPHASVRIDGHLRLGPRSTMRTCGPSTGSGEVVFEDPASSAVTCAAPTPRDTPAVCLSDCQTDADCASAGPCTWCTKAHGAAVAIGSCTEPRAPCKSKADCSYNGDCLGGVCANCDTKSLPYSGSTCDKLLASSGNWLGDDYHDVAASPPSAYKGDVIANWPIGRLGHAATLSPSACPTSGGADDMLVWSLWGPNRDGNQKTYPTLILKQAQNLRPLAGLSQNDWWDPPVVFDYSWPSVDAGCSFNYSQCAGTCPSGDPCGMTTASDCGCPATCAPRSSTADKCGTRIAATTSVMNLGDCGPRDSCWCGRDGKQNVVGTKGCPSYPFAVNLGNNTVLLFYNTGDGKTVGLAQGPTYGPWQVVREPLFPAGSPPVQDPFIYKDVFGWHMLLTDVAAKSGRGAFSEDGRNWVLLPGLLYDLGAPTASSWKFTSMTRPRLEDRQLELTDGCYSLSVDATTTHNPAVRTWNRRICTNDIP